MSTLAVATLVSAAAVAGTAGSAMAAAVNAAPDFVVAATPGTLTTVQGRSAATTVTTSVSGGFNASITLSASGLPAGASATFAPIVMPAPGAGSGTLTLAAGPATSPGSYTVTVAGAGGSLNRSTTVTFVVTTTTVQIFSEGFEGAWTSTWKSWVRPASGKVSAWWGTASNRKAAGSFSAYCAASGGAGVPAPGPYPNNMEGWIKYGPFSLADATGALITFKLWFNNNYDSNDRVQYFVSVNNSSFKGHEVIQPTVGWETVAFDLGNNTYDLDPIGQPQVWFALIFLSNASGQSEGAYVDSVNITKTVSAPTCAVTCGANVPAQAAPGSLVQLSGTLGAGNCTGVPGFAWSFGDGTPGSTQAAPVHSYASAGSYPWSMTATMGAGTCSQSGFVTVTDPAVCTLDCSATVPAAGSRMAAVDFHAEATATDCGSPAAYAWSFGDGAHASTADAHHAYASRGSYPWTLTVTAGTETCTRNGILAIGEPVRRHLSLSH